MVRNKRGMVSVFVMIFSVSIISLAMLFIGGTRAKAISSSVESLGHLWAKSILGEYTDKLMSDMEYSHIKPSRLPKSTISLTSLAKLPSRGRDI